MGVRLADFPEVLQDVFAWNKVFHRAFWDAHVGSFPEGVRYEDQEATGRAYVYAEAFDVLHEVVYDWRVRDDGSSITQQKNDLRDLADRLKVAHRLFDFMSASAPPRWSSPGWRRSWHRSQPVLRSGPAGRAGVLGSAAPTALIGLPSRRRALCGTR